MLAKLELGDDVDVVIRLDLSMQKRSYQEKLFALPRTPFRKTIYLDSDTIVCSDLTPVFSDLDKFDIGFVRASEAVKFAKDDKTFARAKLKTASRLDPSERFYSAFMAYKTSSETLELIDESLRISLKLKLADQEALLAAVRKRDYGKGQRKARVQLLSQEYMYVERVFELPVIVARVVLVVHGVGASCKVNDAKGPRLLFNGKVMQVL